jgi:hypothetical protein
MITRLRLDTALHKPPPRRVPGKVGRPAVVGKRLPALKQRLANPKTRWRRLLVTAVANEWSRSILPQPYGTTMAAAFPSVMSWCVIR